MAKKGALANVSKSRNARNRFFAVLVSGLIGVPLAYASDAVSFPLSTDENLVFFPTDASLDRESASWRIPIHGWVFEVSERVVRKNTAALILERQFGLKLQAENEPYFSERINLLFADNERGKAFWIHLCDRDFQLSASEPNGHFHGRLTIPAEMVARCQSDGQLPFHLLTAKDDNRQFRGTVRLLPPEGVSLISDIDDTVKVTEVTNRKQLLDNTFYQPFRAINGMPAAYQQIADMGVALHFVSSSPWQLYPTLEQFRNLVSLPPASYSLKNVRFRDRDFFNLFKSGDETKPKQIEALLQRFPHRQFILIGDSGEQDPEVYAAMLRRYPEQILGFAIRSIDGTDQQARYERLFHDLSAGRIMVFQDPAPLPGFVADLLQD